MNENEIYYAYEMIYDEAAVSESNIECVGFDKAYIQDYMAYIQDRGYRSSHAGCR